MRPTEFLRMVRAFIRTRYGLRFPDRASLEQWQRRRLDAFLSTTLKQAAFYREARVSELTSLPIVEKQTMLEHFSGFNARGIELENALAAARAAEIGQPPPTGFDPSLTAGLSSGTNGRPGVFLASADERATWAGILLARTLDRDLLGCLVRRMAPLRVAFFLRANSALYTTLRSRLIDFRFFDLQSGAHTHAGALAKFDPDVLVAPASVLAWLASESLDDRLPLQPRKLISVAEALEPDDERQIRAAYGKPVHQLYQCTEGFLAYTCEHGSLHLNEEFVHIEPEWLDETRTRFVPIITDFTRRTQMIVRYRLDDILRLRSEPCRCGRVTRALAAIDGRLDDVLWLPSRSTGHLMPLFPDAVRHAIARHGDRVVDYTLAQHDATLHLAVLGEEAAFASVRRAIDELIVKQGMTPPAWRRAILEARANAAKRRRIVCVTRPSASKFHRMYST